MTPPPSRLEARRRLGPHLIGEADYQREKLAIQDLARQMAEQQVRTHLALGKDAPLGRAVQRSGVIVAIPILSGLHHHYVRI
jgi:hypothetical protein